MIVHDIVRVVSPDAARLTSYPAGRWPVDFRLDRAGADKTADAYNRCLGGALGVRYEVVSRDEMDPARAEDNPALQAAWRGCR